jgi:uncharacterized protein YbbK (DUF523 family)
MFVLLSACLLGAPCRWHGRSVARSRYLDRYLCEHPDTIWVPVCPEVMGGLPTPRPPVKRIKGRIFETCANKSRRRYETGADVTVFFHRGAEATLQRAREFGCRRAVMLRYSPSCDRDGITGRLLRADGIEVLNTF